MKIFRANHLNILVRIALAISVGIIFLQANYIRRLQVEADTVAVRGTLREGLPVPDVDALDWSGKRALISYGAATRPTVIYVFRPGC